MNVHGEGLVRYLKKPPPRILNLPIDFFLIRYSYNLKGIRYNLNVNVHAEVRRCQAGSSRTSSMRRHIEVW